MATRSAVLPASVRSRLDRMIAVFAETEADGWERVGEGAEPPTDDGATTVWRKLAASVWRRLAA